MANPSVVNVPVGQYTKVTTAVVTGQIWKIIETEYRYTYRQTGGAAPTDLDEAVRIFKDDDESDNVVNISANEQIDIYLWAIGSSGKVRVDV